MPTSSLQIFQQSIENYTNDFLSSYIEKLNSSRGPRNRKEFNDPIWGTISFHPLEIAIIDSPLLQRLRRITQLGVAHFVFPGATHTRFEHSLGAVHQIQSLINSLQASRPDTPLIPDGLSRTLRLAALCHDVGHGLMSHVSEKALTRRDEIKDLLLQFGDLFLSGDETKFSEITAYYMLGSPAFKALLSAGKTATLDFPKDFDVEAVSSKIQNAIVGAAISDEIPLLHELVSGPFDADKLDYMTRDAHMAGVPAVTDIPRLVNKVRYAAISESQLPPDIASHVRAGLPVYNVTGIALSGARTLDELMLGRTWLSDKIYRHQKVRSAETMVATIIHFLENLSPHTPGIISYLLNDDDIYQLDESKLASLIPDIAKRDADGFRTVVIDLSRRLRERELFVRAFAFSQNMPDDPYRHQQYKQMDVLIRQCQDLESTAQIIQIIAKETEKICVLLDRTDLCSDLKGPLIHYITIDAPTSTATAGTISHAYLITETGQVIKFKDESAEIRGWADAYLTTRDLGYIFCPARLAPYVFLAAEKVIRCEFEIRVPLSMIAYAKQDPDGINAIRKLLAEKGFYAGAPNDLKPTPERLTKADIPNRLRNICQRLQAYDGLNIAGLDIRKTGMDPARIQHWLQQFIDDDSVECALILVENIRLIGRTDIVAALKNFMDANPEYHNASLCPFGTARDSSAIITYYAGDIATSYSLDIVDIPEAINRDRPIVFVDDFIGKGAQALGIVENYIGEEPTVNLHEYRGPGLNARLAELFRSRKLAFVFAAGWEDGRKCFEQRLREKGLQAEVFVGVIDLPVAFGAGLFGDAAREERFRNVCARIGESLLREEGTARNEGWIKERVLGYGDRALLVVFPYNTPAQTLTCLWATGEFDGLRWESLLPRRKKI